MSVRSQSVGFVSLFSLLFVAACAPGYEADVPVADSELGSVSLALTGESVANAGSIEVEITETGESDPTLVDEFAPNASEVARNFRIPPGVYDIGVKVFAPDGALVATGDAPGVTVSPGDNDLAVTLVPTEEDLSDLFVALQDPPVKFSSISADGLTDQDGFLGVTAIVQPTGDDALPEGLLITGQISLFDGPNDLESPHGSFVMAPTGDGATFSGSLPADWVGRATMEITALVDGQVVDKTTKDVIGIPSDATREIAAAIGSNLTVADDGTLGTIEGLSTDSGFTLADAGLEQLNGAISVINDAVLAGDFIVDADLSNVTGALAFATLGYWQCVLKILKCEVLSAGCIASPGAAVVACAEVCAGTLGLGCVACISAASGGTIALCDAAVKCWQEAKKQRCIP